MPSERLRAFANDRAPPPTDRPPERADIEADDSRLVRNETAEPSGAPLEALPPMPASEPAASPAPSHAPAPGISGPVLGLLAEWRQRKCRACGARRPFYGFGPPLSRAFVWACDEHRQQVEAELEVKRRA